MNYSDWVFLFMGNLDELFPHRKRLSGPSQSLPALWETGDAALTRISEINWRTRGFFSELIDEFVAPFQVTPPAPFIIENDSAAQAAMIVERPGSYISDEFIRGTDNASAMSWLGCGHARHGPSALTQVGIFHLGGNQ